MTESKTEFGKIVHIAKAMAKTAMKTTAELCGTDDAAQGSSLILVATAFFLKSQLETNQNMFGIDYDKSKDMVIGLLNNKSDVAHDKE